MKRDFESEYLSAVAKRTRASTERYLVAKLCAESRERRRCVDVQRSLDVVLVDSDEEDEVDRDQEVRAKADGGRARGRGGEREAWFDDIPDVELLNSPIGGDEADGSGIVFLGEEEDEEEEMIRKGKAKMVAEFGFVDIAGVGVGDGASTELHRFENQLQMVALKKGYDLPTYTFERVGPPHDSRFKSKVTVNGQAYESSGFFGTLKDSENAAAEAALLSLVPPESQDDILDKSVFKNMLQELTQKSGLKIPVYITTSSGASHMPAFVSTVVVDGETFYGEEAKTKKLAEMNAAEVAYNCLSQRNGRLSTVADIVAGQIETDVKTSEVPRAQSYDQPIMQSPKRRYGWYDSSDDEDNSGCHEVLI